MTKAIAVAVIGGILAGFLFVPEGLVGYTNYLISGGLCLILFMTGLDMGLQGDTFRNIKQVGFKIFLVPAAIILGTLSFSALLGLVMPGFSVREIVAVSAGLGWYSLAPMILLDYSAELSAMAFMANVFRELFGILLIPLVAKKVGFIEAVGPPGASSMDTCLPVIISSTHERVTMYAVISGVVLSFAVPILVPLIMEF